MTGAGLSAFQSSNVGRGIPKGPKSARSPNGRDLVDNMHMAVDDRPQITVLPGVPGMDGLTVDDNRVPYPESTQDFVKCARLLGIAVGFTEPKEDRRYVGFKALEVWLPILEITRDLLIGVEGGLLVELLKSYLRPGGSAGEASGGPQAEGGLEIEAPRTIEAPSSTTLLHVDWHVIDGTRESRFRADGDADSVLRALAQFEQSTRDE